ncbi:MAG TPA: ATPase domain-containing protein, partial [Candidatus Wallbacteria bacterium]|nr:ATPase domain-containing protein [Candidatus Wallbacteria bacterium]
MGIEKFKAVKSAALKSQAGTIENCEKKAETKPDAKAEVNCENDRGKEAQELSLIKQQILKKFGRGSIFSYEDSRPDDKSIYEPISTGIISLDAALGIGGLPSGRIIELYGPESSGKTTLTLNIIANFQKSGKIAAFIDAEHALDINYAKKIGVDLSKLLVSQPASGEECFDICNDLVK